MVRRGCLTTFAILILALVGTTGWLIWRASDASLPPLAKGLSRHINEGDQQFKRRIEGQYPVGSPEAKLISDLKSQGFQVTVRLGESSEGRLSRFIGCGDKVWSVYWHAGNGKLTKVLANYGAVCL